MKKKLVFLFCIIPSNYVFTMGTDRAWEKFQEDHPYLVLSAETYRNVKAGAEQGFGSALAQTLFNEGFKLSLYGFLYAGKEVKEGYLIVCNTRQLHKKQNKLKEELLKLKTNVYKKNPAKRQLLENQKIMLSRSRSKKDKAHLDTVNKELETLRKTEKSKKERIKEIKAEIKDIKDNIKENESNVFFKRYTRTIRNGIKNAAQWTGRKAGFLTTPLVCAQCGKEEIKQEKFVQCYQCKQVWYCSNACGKQYWNEHHYKTCKPNTTNDADAISTSNTNQFPLDKIASKSTPSEKVNNLGNTQEIVKTCALPLCNKEAVMDCCGCQAVGYCSNEHGELHWECAHHKNCVAGLANDEETNKAESELTKLADEQTLEPKENKLRKYAIGAGVIGVGALGCLLKANG